MTASYWTQGTMRRGFLPTTRTIREISGHCRLDLVRFKRMAIFIRSAFIAAPPIRRLATASLLPLHEDGPSRCLSSSDSLAHRFAVRHCGTENWAETSERPQRWIESAQPIPESKSCDQSRRQARDNHGRGSVARFQPCAGRSSPLSASLRCRKAPRWQSG